MNTIDTNYINLIKDIISNGISKVDRTGIGTKSVFGRQIRINLAEGFPLLTCKETWFKGIVIELCWFLKKPNKNPLKSSSIEVLVNSLHEDYKNGIGNIKYLVDRNCNIWNDNAYSLYLKKCKEFNINPLTQNEYINKIKNLDRALSINFNTFEDLSNKENNQSPVHFKYGDVGPIYGSQWRNWNTDYKMRIKNGIDQIENVINQLKQNPDDRGIIISAWSTHDLDNMALRPCHTMFQFYSRNCNGVRYLDCQLYQRSCDLGLGFGFNVASYALLIYLIANATNHVPGEFIHTFGDIHIYSNHLKELQKLSEIDHNYILPSVSINFKDKLEDYELEDFTLNNYTCGPKIKLQMAI